MAREPKTLQDAILYFSDPENCLNYLAARRWKNGVAVCPRCGSKNVGFIASRRVWQCKDRHPKAQFSIKVGTIFEDSPIGLDKWLLAMWMLANCKNGISSYEISRATGISQKSSWFMLQRIRLALQGEAGGKLSGEVEVDETFIGGKARNMHRSVKRRRNIQGGGVGKEIVIGLLERGKKIRAGVITDRGKDTIQRAVRSNVEQGSTIYSDEHVGSWRMDSDYAHEVARYYLRKLQITVDGSSEPQYTPNEDKPVTLEHILPRNPGPERKLAPDDAAALYNRLGNQALLAGSVNSRLGNVGFEDKKDALAQSPFSLTSACAKEKDWGTEEISRRQEALAGFGVKAWPLLI